MSSKVNNLNELDIDHIIDYVSTFKRKPNTQRIVIVALKSLFIGYLERNDIDFKIVPIYIGDDSHVSEEDILTKDEIDDIIK